MPFVFYWETEVNLDEKGDGEKLGGVADRKLSSGYIMWEKETLFNKTKKILFKAGN